MLKKVKIFKDLPIEEGKTYKTRFATGDMFLVKKVIKNPNKSLKPEQIIRVDGIYWNAKEIGICPLAADRLIPERIMIGEKIICEDSDFDLTEIIIKTFEAGQRNANDYGNNYGGLANYLSELK